MPLKEICGYVAGYRLFRLLQHFEIAIAHFGCDLEADMQRLLYVLQEVSAGDPKIFSFALQSFLAYMTINWPDGVFQNDFALPSRGRPFSSLDIDSWVLTSRCGYGWRGDGRDRLLTVSSVGQ